MQLNLERSNRFQKEILEYREELSNITNDSIKLEIEDLIKKLIHEVRLIDSQHEELLSGHKLPGMVTDSRQKILELRRKISKKIKSCK